MKAQREMVTEEGVSTGQLAADAAAAARQQKRAEQKAARESELMVQVGSRLSPSQPAPAVSGPAEPQAKGNASAAPRDASGLQRKSDFTATFDRHGDINPHTLAQPHSPNTLFAGRVLAANIGRASCRERVST